MFRDEFKERYTTIPFAIHRSLLIKQLIPHQHKEIELIAMTEGAADFYVDSLLYKVEKGDVLVIPPYAIHRAEIRTGETASYDCICFDLDLLWDEALRAGLNDHALTVSQAVSHSLPYTPHLHTLIGDSCTACEEKKAGWELEVIGSMSLLFGILKRNGYFVSNVPQKGESTFASRVMRYITEHYAAPITSTSAADAFYMNHSYFCRTFKKHFGCPFSAYVLVYRLEKAKIYLGNNTQASIADVALQTGFSSQSYFGQAFKERFGISPLAYRKQSGK